MSRASRGLGRWCGLLAALLSSAPASAAAQLGDGGSTVEQVAPGVCAITHADTIHDFPGGTTDWPHRNVGVVVGRRRILVVDSDNFLSRAAADITLIRRISPQPVCYLVNTHSHGDPTHGNGVYRDRFPAIEIVGTRETRGFIGVNQERVPRRVLAAGSLPRSELARLVALRRVGTDSSEHALDAGALRLLDKVIAELENELSEFARIASAPPTRIRQQFDSADLKARWADPRSSNQVACGEQSIATSLIERTYYCVLGSRC